jgi:tRNA (guanine37-N1)-methyltransferase
MNDESRQPSDVDPYGVVVITLFPEMFDSFFRASLLGKGLDAGIIREHRVDPREFTSDVHRTVDDAPFGGGAGMIMKPEPMAAAITRARDLAPAGAVCALMTPQAPPLDQRRAESLAQAPGLILVCGRYEGVDDRIRNVVDETISIGDYVLSGGEVAAMVVVEAVTRLLPGVLGNAASPQDESFTQGLLEYPQYTRPAQWEGREVPEVLRSGDHARVRAWRRAQALHRTAALRPDLFAQAELDDADRRLMREHPPPGDGDGDGDGNGDGTTSAP